MAQLVTEIEDRGNQAELREERLREESRSWRKLASAEEKASKVRTRPSAQQDAAQRAVVDHQRREQGAGEIGALRRQIEELSRHMRRR